LIARVVAAKVVVGLKEELVCRVGEDEGRPEVGEGDGRFEDDADNALAFA
jgi:hypothetical protein